MKNPFLVFLLAACGCGLSEAHAGEPVDILSENLLINGDADVSVVLRDGAELASKKKFAPPVKITYRIRTDGDIRLGYAADQIILNWSRDEMELRVNGGPVDRQHVTGGGSIPKNKFLTVVQTVLADRMTITVNGIERAAWKADFSQVDEQVRVFPHQSTITVKEIVVEPGVETARARKTKKRS